MGVECPCPGFHLDAQAGFSAGTGRFGGFGLVRACGAQFDRRGTGTDDTRGLGEDRSDTSTGSTGKGVRHLVGVGAEVRAGTTEG